jgi:hypothetical protein
LLGDALRHVIKAFAELFDLILSVFVIPGGVRRVVGEAAAAETVDNPRQPVQPACQ